ncbi:DUF3618 domain-containing protein [Benzoatithermus flavus]|uniref:DUF3618 domain-containing protein n=1 Tax=Benzoatithermus flavus TaxID=3108223 RepID=A0ABU8XTB0_9PROT
MEGSSDTNRIERDLEHTRSRLDATIDALQQKLSPGQMVDEAFAWFREGGGAEFGRNLARTVRDHPMPVALIGVGLAWLAVSSARERSGGSYDSSRGAEPYDRDERSRGYVGRETPAYGPRAYAGSSYGATVPHQPMPYEAAAYEDLATKARDAGSRVERRTGESEESYRERVYAAKASVLGVTRQASESLSAFVDRVETALSAAADRFRQAAQRAGDMASDMAERVTSTASSMSSRAGDTADRGKAGLRSLYGYGQSAAYGVRDSASYAAWRARDVGSRTADYLQDQPLLMGVLGVTVGAILGMLIPPTRYEREMLGSIRQDFKEQAREMAGQAGQGVMRAAEAMLDTAHDAARREGLADMSPSGVVAGARQQVADAAGRVRTVVEETVTAGREALERELSPEASDQQQRDRTDGDTTAMTSGTTGGAGEHGDRRAGT